MEREVLFCESNGTRGLGSEDEEAGSVKMTDYISAAREYDEGSVGRISNLMLDVRELQEPLLYGTALSPMPIKRAGPLMYGEKRRCLWEKCLSICKREMVESR